MKKKYDVFGIIEKQTEKKFEHLWHAKHYKTNADIYILLLDKQILIDYQEKMVLYRKSQTETLLVMEVEKFYGYMATHDGKIEKRFKKVKE